MSLVLPKGQSHSGSMPRSWVRSQLFSDLIKACTDTIQFCRALVGATDANGKSIFVGKAFTGFSNVEEEQVNMVQVSILYMFSTRDTF